MHFKNTISTWSKDNQTVVAIANVCWYDTLRLMLLYTYATSIFANFCLCPSSYMKNEFLHIGLDFVVLFNFGCVVISFLLRDAQNSGSNNELNLFLSRLSVWREKNSAKFIRMEVDLKFKLFLTIFLAE